MAAFFLMHHDSLSATLPVKKGLGTPINEIIVSQKSAYCKILKTIELNYKKSNFYKDVFNIMSKVLSEEHDKLVDTNNALFIEILELLGKKIDLKKPDFGYSNTWFGFYCFCLLSFY